MILAGLLMLVSAAGADDAGFRPARPGAEADSAVVRCYAIHNRTGPVTGSIGITVIVNAKGSATAVTTPPASEERLAVAAQCAGVMLTYLPAKRDGVPVDDKLVLTVTFATLPTPRIPVRSAIDYCHAPWAIDDLKEGELDLPVRVGRDGKKCCPAGRTDEARINYRITVSKGGRAYRVELMESSGDPALDGAGICILRHLAFFAAHRNVHAVESTLNWPILVRPPG